MSLIDVQIIELFGLDKGHFIIGEEHEEITLSCLGLAADGSTDRTHESTI